MYVVGLEVCCNTGGVQVQGDEETRGKSTKQRRVEVG
jgi:hypothetical protein